MKSRSYKKSIETIIAGDVRISKHQTEILAYGYTGGVFAALEEIDWIYNGRIDEVFLKIPARLRRMLAPIHG